MSDPQEPLLDKELAVGFLEVPDGFEQRVMARIGLEPLPEGLAERSAERVGWARPGRRARRWIEWLALIGGTLVGLLQLFAFIFGVWTTSNLS